MINLKEEVKKLMALEVGTVLSLYQHTHRRGADVEQGPIQFKNLMREAEEKLEPHLERGVLPRIMEKLERIQRNTDFWRHRTEGLALFVAGDEIYTFDLPEQVQNKVYVGQAPHVLPLIEVYQKLAPHYVLELYKDRFSLYHGDGQQLDELKTEELPKAFAELFDDMDSESKFHAGSSPRGRTDGVMHGVRSKPEEVEKDKEKYYRYLDNELTPLLRELGEPVILAGLKENIADYRQVTDDPIYAAETLEKPIRDLGDTGYAERIREILEKHYTRRIDSRMESLERALANSGASTDQEEIRNALEMGRVEALLIRTEFKEESREQLDQLAQATYQQSGEVIMVPVTTDAMDKSLAALYRY